MSTTPTLYPSFRFRDAKGAIGFLEAAFGFRRLVAYENEDGTIAHAELAYGPSVLMLGSDRDDMYGARAGRGWLYVAVDDPDAHCEQARAHGAEIVQEPEDTDYGARGYVARDPEGNLWSFGTYRPAPSEAGESAAAAAG